MENSFEAHRIHYFPLTSGDNSKFPIIGILRQLRYLHQSFGNAVVYSKFFPPQHLPNLSFSLPNLTVFSTCLDDRVLSILQLFSSSIMYTLCQLSAMNNDINALLKPTYYFLSFCNISPYQIILKGGKSE